MKVAGLWFSLVVVLVLGSFALSGCSGGGYVTTPAPTGVTATSGDGQATIAWTPVAGATSYNVYWSTTTGVTPANGTKVADVTNPYTLTGLTNGTTYYFVVTAVNHNSSGSGESVASTQANCIPAPVPTGVTATPGDAKATISWTAVQGATSYNIYWSTTTGLTPANGTKITGATSPYTLTGLTNGTAYYFVVTAVNDDGESGVSTEVSGTPALSAPTGVTATPGNGQTIVAWTPVTDATSYNIYWSTTTGVTPTNGYQITGAANPYTLSGLTNGTTYYYVVTAVSANGESAASSQVSATPSLTPPPAAPAGLTTTPGDGQVSIGWTLLPNVDSYNIYWSTTTGVTSANGTKITGATNPYVLTGLVNDTTTYYFVVTAVNGNGESAASSEVSCIPARLVPTGVAAVPGNTQVTIAWTAVPGANSYNLYWSEFPGVTPKNGNFVANVTNPYTLTNLTNGKTYYFVVTEVNDTGESKASSQVSTTPN